MCDVNRVWWVMGDVDRVWWVMCDVDRVWWVMGDVDRVWWVMCDVDRVWWVMCDVDRVWWVMCDVDSVWWVMCDVDRVWWDQTDGALVDGTPCLRSSRMTLGRQVKNQPQTRHLTNSLHVCWGLLRYIGRLTLECLGQDTEHTGVEKKNRKFFLSPLMQCLIHPLIWHITFSIRTCCLCPLWHP